MKQRWKRQAALSAALTASLALSACASSGGGSSKGAGGTPTATASGSAVLSAGGTPSGKPLKLGMIADVGTAVDFADEVSAARAAVAGVNRRGGVNGRPLELVFCNGSLDPTKAAACVRSVLAEKPVAMVGSEIVTYEQSAAKQFAAAGVANVSPVPYSYFGQDPNSYLLSPGQTFLNAGMDVAAVKYGGKRVALARVDIPVTATYVTVHKKLVPLLGGTFSGDALASQVEAPNYAALAASLLQGNPDVLNTNCNESCDLQVFKEMDSLGFKGKQVINQDAYSLASVKSLGELAKRVIFVSSYPPVSDVAKYPGLKQFQADMAAQAATGDKRASDAPIINRDVVFDAYLGVIAVARIASTAKAENAASFKKAIDAATNVDLDGIVPPWTPNKTISKVLPRVSTGTTFISEWDGTQEKQLGDPLEATYVAGLVDKTN